jgi:5-methylcytosine-specific restriction endonuclease McrA
MKRKRKKRPVLREALVLKALKRQALHEQGGKCHWCGEPLAVEDATADHLVPRYAGGTTRHGNIVAACKRVAGGVG